MIHATSLLAGVPFEGKDDSLTSAAFSARGGRSELAALHLRVADALERSAQLAETHAERERSKGRSPAVELDRATRAGKAARRARELASQLEDSS